LTSAIKDLAEFAGMQSDDIIVALNTDFYERSLTPQLGTTITGLVNGKIIAWSDAIHMIKTGAIELPEGRSIEDIGADIAQQSLNDSLTD
jgi:hypothetical protein